MKSTWGRSTFVTGNNEITFPKGCYLEYNYVVIDHLFVSYDVPVKR